MEKSQMMRKRRWSKKYKQFPHLKPRASLLPHLPQLIPMATKGQIESQQIATFEAPNDMNRDRYFKFSF